MPTVPYQPVPHVEPRNIPTPSVGLSVPGEAFGTGVAQAMTGLGHTLGQAGEEFGRTALAFQQLINEAWSKEADVNADVEIGKENADFRQKEGLNSVAELDAHSQRIKDIRQKALESAPNLAARRMLDASLSRRVAFAIVNSGLHAGDQAKIAANRASTARVETTQAQFDPSNPAQADQALRDIDEETRYQGQVHGDAPAVVENNIRKAKGKAWVNGLRHWAPNEPDKAQELFEQIKEGLDPDDRNVAQGIVNNAMASKQSRDDAYNLLSGKAGLPAFDPTAGPGQMAKYEKAAEGLAEEKGKNNPAYRDYLFNHLRSRMTQLMATYQDTTRHNEGVLYDAMTGWATGGPKPTNIDDLLAAPQNREAWEALPGPKKQAVLDRLTRNTRGDVGWTPERVRTADRLRGMEPSEFYALGPDYIMDQDIPISEKRALLALQRTIMTKQQPIAVARAMTQLDDTILRPAGITREGDPGGYAQFRGALMRVMEEWQADNKKAMPPEEIRKLGARLMQDQKEHWGWVPSFLQSKQPLYSIPVPDDEAAAMEDQAAKLGYPKPTEEEKQRMYFIKKYKGLWSGEGKGDKK